MVRLWQSVRHLLRPLKKHQVAGIREHLIEPERRELRSALETVRVYVHKALKGNGLGKRVYLHKHECRALDRVRYPERPRNALRECGLPCAKLSRKRHEGCALLLRSERLGEACRSSLCLFERVELLFHGTIVPIRAFRVASGHRPRYHGRMTVRFDSEAEDEKLSAIHEREEEDLARIVADKYRVPYIDISMYPINMDALRLIPEADARAAEALVFDKNGKHLLIAFHSVENEHLNRVLHDLETRGYIIERHMASRRGLLKVFERYEDLSLAAESKQGVFDISGDELTELTHKLDNLPSLRMFLTDAVNPAKRAQTSKLLEGILASSLSLRASDIHIEPEDATIRLRFRLDGILTDVFYFDAHAYKLLNSRIKLLSGLKLNVDNRAQDGRFSVVVNEKEIEVRTSLIPGNYGENIVLRLLDPSGIERSFADSGIHEKLYNRLSIEIRRPNGMLLTTGPTGSGKTTTLYSFLKEIHTPDIKIITIEDPIEYHLPGIVQTQTDGREYTFAAGLRSILRQDPDVIMVGEIRDMEVAETAIQAALTGHFVFSTLHTNNAAGAFPRLMDLGIDPKTIPSAVTVAMGQRLVRTLNQETKVLRKTTDEERRIMERAFSTLADQTLMPASFDEVWAAQEGEDDSGYKGRTGVHEAIFMDQQLADLLRMGPSSAEIEAETRRQGFLTMAQDGILKAIRGETSLEEVFKVVDVPRE